MQPLEEDCDLDLAVKKVSHVFGIAAVQRSAVFPKDMEEIVKRSVPYLKDVLQRAKSFKVEAKRSVKSFPLGCNGSPVAAYMMAKRGLRVDAIHFQSPPYTSERALMKVETLCEKLTEYCGSIRFYCVPFTEIQEALRDNCDNDYFTVIMRRLMLKIANVICERGHCGALITGESVGQVASQTLAEVPRRIDTFETSILPYEDCCTVFTPKHPKTKPLLEDVLKEEEKFDFAPLLKKAIEGITVRDFKI